MEHADSIKRNVLSALLCKAIQIRCFQYDMASFSKSRTGYIFVAISALNIRIYWWCGLRKVSIAARNMFAGYKKKEKKGKMWKNICSLYDALKGMDNL